MKTATYNKIGGGTFTVEYDENAPCIVCGEPVREASVGGTALCPCCDMGKCRYCGESYLSGREQTREECQAVIRQHVAQCKCEKLISNLCDSECPHCNRPLNLPDEEQIEIWLRGEK